MQKGIKRRQRGRGRHWVDYLPVAIVVTLSVLFGLAKQVSYGTGFEVGSWMTDAMGFFLLSFSMFKFFDLNGFADGFQMYDLLAKNFRPYAYIYPFIEAALGLGFLSGWQQPVFCAVTIVVMAWGAAGVFVALKKGLDIECACMGSILHVPLSTVALVEDLGMTGMAVIMLLCTFIQF